MKRVSRLLLWAFGSFAVITITGTMLLQIGLGLPGRLDFYCHRVQYERIVAEAKSRQVPADNPATQLIGGKSVYVTHDASGGCVVTIITKDWNHAGIFGYVYSDQDLPAIPVNGTEEKMLPVSGKVPLFVTTKLGGHWWAGNNPWH